MKPKKKFKRIAGQVKGSVSLFRVRIVKRVTPLLMRLDSLLSLIGERKTEFSEKSLYSDIKIEKTINPKTSKTRYVITFYYSPESIKRIDFIVSKLLKHKKSVLTSKKNKKIIDFVDKTINFLLELRQEKPRTWRYTTMPNKNHLYKRQKTVFKKRLLASRLYKWFEKQKKAKKTIKPL